MKYVHSKAKEVTIICWVLTIQWNSVNKSTVNKSSRLLHPICLERNRLVHFRKRRLLKPPRIKSKTGCPEMDLLTEFHCNRQLFFDCYTFDDVFYSCLNAKVKANCFYEYENDDFLFGIHLRTFYENF